MAPTVYKISEDVVKSHYTYGDYENIYEDFPKFGDKLAKSLIPYVTENFPQIKRGDVIELELSNEPMHYRKQQYMFWDGKEILLPFSDFYDYGGGGPPLSFKSITEFPIGYFADYVFFSDVIYLDYDTFMEQIENLRENYDEEANDDDKNWENLFVTYKGQKYPIYDEFGRDNYTCLGYLEILREGQNPHVMLVDKYDKIVDIDGYRVDDLGRIDEDEDNY